jgi:hypothetical protein
MANLKASVMIRVTTAVGVRGWVKATGGKNDPAGPFYLRYYKDSRQRHVKAGDHNDEALVAQHGLVRKLDAESRG